MFCPHKYWSLLGFWRPFGELLQEEAVLAKRCHLHHQNLRNLCIRLRCWLALKLQLKPVNLPGFKVQLWNSITWCSDSLNIWACLAHRTFAQPHQTLQKASSSRNQTPTNVSTDRFVEMVAKDEHMLWKDVTELAALFPIFAGPGAPAVQTSG